VDRTPRYTQVKAPRGTFPPAGSTSSGLAASEYTQTSPTPARGTQYALSVSWCSLDHRLRRPKKGSPCTLGFYKLGASAGPPCRLIYYQNKQEMENTMYIDIHRLPISLRVWGCSHHSLVYIVDPIEHYINIYVKRNAKARGFYSHLGIFGYIMVLRLLVFIVPDMLKYLNGQCISYLYIFTILICF